MQSPFLLWKVLAGQEKKEQGLTEQCVNRLFFQRAVDIEILSFCFAAPLIKQRLQSQSPTGGWDKKRRKTTFQMRFSFPPRRYTGT